LLFHEIGLKLNKNRSTALSARNEAMELYYKDLISEEASLEKLVDDLLLVVQGAEKFAQTASVEEGQRAEIVGRLAHLKERCHRLQEQAKSTALAADKVLRRNPYSSIGVAFAIGIAAGVFICRRK
jgi:ElaB/YqjD/DUF883 family membrane-anchored ribosome-binding protein